MNKRKKYILLLAAMGVFLIGGCAAKEEAQEMPGGIFINEVLSSEEKQATEANETQSITSDEVQAETLFQSEESAKAKNAPVPEPGSNQETEPKQTSPAKEVNYMSITHVFKPYEQAVEISLQIPEDWKYTIWDVEEESTDWGYSVNADGREDADFHIWGQFGTLTADGYSNEPKSFQTSQGLTGLYSWDEYMLDDGSPAIQGMIVFDTELAGFYGASFNMPKSVYSENKDIIDKMFQSIVIKEA